MLIGLVEEAITGGPSASLLPGLVAFVLAPPAAVFGPRLPPRVLGVLGPLGAALIARRAGRDRTVVASADAVAAA
jgi:hypothetical protein